MHKNITVAGDCTLYKQYCFYIVPVPSALNRATSAPFKIHYSITFRYQSITRVLPGRNPVSASGSSVLHENHHRQTAVLHSVVSQSEVRSGCS